MPKLSGSSRGHARLFVNVLGACVAYATLRYNVFASVPWADWPLYVSNKGISLAGATLIALSYLANRAMPTEPARRDGRRVLARSAGLTGVALAVVHVLISFAILGEFTYPSLFERGELNTAGWVCLTSGALATTLFGLPAVRSFQSLRPVLGARHWKRSQQVGYLALALTAVHVLAIGGHNWTVPAAWPGHLPPISLLSFLVCLAPIGAKLVSLGRRGATGAVQQSVAPGPATEALSSLSLGERQQE